MLRDVQHALYGLYVNAGKQVLAAMMEADRVAICGANDVPDASRKAVRGGITKSSVVLGGQPNAIAKQRTLTLEHGELELPTFAWAAWPLLRLANRESLAWPRYSETVQTAVLPRKEFADLRNASTIRFR